jgi:hypothetical protein
MRDIVSPETQLDEIITELGGYSAASPAEVAAAIVQQKSKGLTMYVLTLGVRARMTSLRYKPRQGHSNITAPSVSRRISEMAGKMGDILNKWTLANGVKLAHATKPMLLAEAQRNEQDAKVYRELAKRMPNNDVMLGDVVDAAQMARIGT